MSSLEYIHRVAQQVLITNDEQGINYAGSGSGFFLEYNENMFFITAAHLLYSEQNTHELISDYLQVVIDNEKHKREDQLLGKYFPIKEIYVVGKVDVELLSMIKEAGDKIKGTRDFVECGDIAFSLIRQEQISHIFEIKTSEWSNEGRIECASGAFKIPIEQHIIGGELKAGEECLVHGITMSDPKAIFMQPTLRHFFPLLYDGSKALGDYILSFNHVVYDEWKGLSGSPVFNKDYQLIGVLLRADERTNTIVVSPISNVLEKLDYFLCYFKK